jgi:hypothetical protein
MRTGRSVGTCGAAALLGSTGSVDNWSDTSLAKSFFGSLQLELLDEPA